MSNKPVLIFFVGILAIASCSKEADNTPVTVRAYLDTTIFKKNRNWDLYLDSVRMGRLPHSPTEPACYVTPANDSARSLDFTIQPGSHKLLFVSLDTLYSWGYDFHASAGACMSVTPR
jgi:hypothetical protein